MTEAKKAAMLLYLNDECKDEGYEIFSDEDFLGLYPAALGVKKEEIARKFETGEYSLRGLAREYNVSHKTISLIVDQRAKRKNDEYNRTHWMYYRPDAETMREAHRKSKEYKKRLYEKGELK